MCDLQMPEGCEIRIISEYLNKHISGKTLLNIEWNEKSRYFKPNRQGIVGIPSYDELLRYLPRKVIRIWPRGKVIVFELEGNIFITSQLAMEGKWSNTPLNHSGVVFNFGFVFPSTTIGGNNINVIQDRWYYDDSRHMGQFSIYMNQHSLNTLKFKDHGPDLLLTALVQTNNIDVSTLHPLQITMSIEEWRKCISNKRIAKKRISDYLKDQERFSGLGNYLRSNILYEAKIRPDRPLCQLSTYEIDLLYYTSLHILLDAYQHRGLSLKSWQDPEGIGGTYPSKVYGRTHDDNGYPVIKSKFTKSKSEQSIHWVPQVQF